MGVLGRSSSGKGGKGPPGKRVNLGVEKRNPRHRGKKKGGKKGRVKKKREM